MNASLRMRDKQIISANGGSKILMDRRLIEYSSCTDVTSEAAQAKLLADVYAFILEGHEKRASRSANGYEDGEV